MKIQGKKLDGPAIEILVIPRGDIDIVFQAQCVTDYTEFEAIYKVPKPPFLLVRGDEEQVPDFKNKKYIEKMSDYAKAQTNYMILKSLEVTEDLEWETVEMTDPETWGNYNQELLDAGFSSIHIGRIVNLVSIANGLDERMIIEAKKRFLATKLEAAAESTET